LIEGRGRDRPQAKPVPITMARSNVQRRAKTSDWRALGAPVLATTGDDPILVVAPDDEFRAVLAREIESLPARVQLADDLDRAEASHFDRPPHVVLIAQQEIDADAIEQRLAALRIRTGDPDLVPIAFGRAPTRARRLALRQAGVDLALFGRFGRHALRFQINRARASWARRAPRGELRAPMEWRTRIFSSGRTKEARCYSLSSGGAYFVTPRPFVVGSEIALELPIGRRRLLVAGHVLYTGTGDTSANHGLPRGMAIGFDPLSERVQNVIRRGISASQRGLQV
jgi:Tfp pilus assembly protein PilZ